MHLIPVNSICTLFALICLVGTCPAYAQSPFEPSAEIERCAESTSFSPDSLVGGTKDAIAKSVKAFVHCLDTTPKPNDPEIQYFRGTAFMFIESAEGKRKARDAFCSAASDGYMPAQEMCAVYSGGNTQEQYRWTIAAALNGSVSAQNQISINSWEKLAKQRDLKFDNYLVQYLGCHPSMLRQWCSSTDTAEYRSECLKAMKEVAIKNLTNLAQCHSDLKVAFSGSADRRQIEEWESRANVQLSKTLDSIRKQVKRFPRLAALQIIEP